MANKPSFLVCGIIGGIANYGCYLAGGFTTAMVLQAKLATQTKGGTLTPRQWVRVGEAALRMTRHALVAPTQMVRVQWVLNGSTAEETTVVEQMQEEMKGGMLDFCFELYDEVASEYYDAIQQNDTDHCISLAKQARLQALVVVEEAKALGRTNLQQSWERLVSDWDRKIDGLESINDMFEEAEAKPVPFYPAGYGTLTSTELERLTQQENVFSAGWRAEPIAHMLSEQTHHIAILEHEGEPFVYGRFLGKWTVVGFAADVADYSELELLAEMEITVFDAEGKVVGPWDIPADLADKFEEFQQEMVEVLFS